MEFLGGGSCLDLVNIAAPVVLHWLYMLTGVLAETGGIQRGACGYYMPAAPGRSGLSAQ